VKRAHEMPFGAQLDADGTTRFRLWAPGASQVELVMPAGRSAMVKEAGGWYAARMEGIAPGSRYRYRIDDRIDVPDPASRFNPEDIHGPSAVVDPRGFEWPDSNWRGRPWEEAVIYELHIGTFTPQGTFNAAIERLDYLVRLGVTALEIMPVGEFPGTRSWGYDGVLPFAPDASYGTPEDLKSLVAAAHARGLMVYLDVVYNHFGPEGNYLGAYAPQFFNSRHQTPWGDAINFDGERSRTVRDFFIHNALYWLDEFHFDGLRLDAVHAIADDTRPHILEELASTVRAGPGANRHVHLILENDRNEARFLRRANGSRALLADGQWNDDAHHALHVLATGEQDGYYGDYAQRPLWFLGRTLAEGFGFQGEASAYRKGERRGQDSRALPPSAFIVFSQTHDQVGNRALGERIAQLASEPALKLGLACLLLAPSVPLLFMGEEFAASSPFLYFCDFGEELAARVREGRQREFASFQRFSPEGAAPIPDPAAPETFLRSKLRWEETAEPGHRDWHTFYSELLEVRRRLIVPHLAGSGHRADFSLSQSERLAVDWILGDGTQLSLRANFSDREWPGPEVGPATIFSIRALPDRLLPWGGVWALETKR
jgi:maltooligosyltrehalose trehalohydrolase